MLPLSLRLHAMLESMDNCTTMPVPDPDQRMNRTAQQVLLHAVLSLFWLGWSGLLWAAGDGLLGTYYDQNGTNGAWFTGNTIQRIDSTVDFDWWVLGPFWGFGFNDFSVRWEGELEIPVAGNYTFRTRSDDGVRLYLDLNRDGDFNDSVAGVSELLISNWSNHAARNDDSSVIAIGTVGKYPIKMEFYERGGNALAELYWSGPATGGFQIIPQTYLYSSSPARVESLVLPCASSPDTLILTFSKAVSAATANDAGNYSINNGASIDAASLQPDGMTVWLSVSNIQNGSTYALAVSGVEDTDGQPLDPAYSSASLTVRFGELSAGLLGEYYDQNDIAGAYFSGNVIEQVDATVDFRWNGNAVPIAGMNKDHFSMRWTGYVRPTVSEDYTFYTRSDDGVRLYVNGQLVIDNWTDHGQTTDSSAALSLQAGVDYSIELEYYENAGNAVIELSWSSPSVTQTIIPAAQLFYCREAVSIAAQWWFDETAWSGNAGEVLDASGNGHDGMAINGLNNSSLNPAIAGSPGTCRYAAMDGSQDAIEIPHQADLNGTAGLSYLAWVRADDWSGKRYIISKSTQSGGTGAAQMALYADANQLYGEVETLAGNYKLSAALPPQGGWVHLALVFSGDALRLYQDANLLAQSAFGSTSLVASNDPLMIGKRYADNASYFAGSIDEVMIFPGALSVADIDSYRNMTRVCATLDHFDIDVGSVSSTCLSKQIGIRALDAGGNLLSDYANQVSLSLSSNHGDWSSLSVLPLPGGDSSADPPEGSLSAGPGDSGQATYQFVPGSAAGQDNGQVTLFLTNQHAEDFTVTVSDPVYGVQSQSTVVSFRDNVFVLASAAPAYADDVVAGRAHRMSATLYQRDSNQNPPECAVASQYQGNKALKMWLQRAADDPAGLAPGVQGSSLTAALPDTAPVATNVDLQFVAGIAEFDLLTSDVGHYALTLLDDSAQFAATDVQGSSQQWVVRPFGFELQVSGNGGASDHSGALMAVTAGENFSVTAVAKGWQSGDDADDDGEPDFYRDNNAATLVSLADNISLPAFGQEAMPETVLLSAYLVSPAGGSDPGLQESTVNGRILQSFAAGSASTSQVYFAEVGVIEILARLVDGDYLGSGRELYGASGFVGRFRPHHFSASLPVVTNACSTAGGDFTYMGQAFDVSLSLTAENALGQQTVNYDANYVKFAAPDALQFGARDSVAASLLSSRLSAVVSPNWWVQGSGLLLADLILARDSAPDGPYAMMEVGVLAADDDGVTLDPVALDFDSDANGSPDQLRLGLAPQRFGRLRGERAFGPESAPLPVFLAAEFWDGDSFVLNDLDSCSRIGRAAIALNGLANTLSNDANRSVTVGASSTTAEFGPANIQMDATHLQLSAGASNLVFSAPGAGGQGSVTVDVDLSALPWLQYDWDQDGDYNDSDDQDLPQFDVSFGSYRGHDRVIHWQEILK